MKNREKQKQKNKGSADPNSASVRGEFLCSVKEPSRSVRVVRLLRARPLAPPNSEFHRPVGVDTGRGTTLGVLRVDTSNRINIPTS